MKILIACEFSGIVRDAFIKKGHDAYSCDILPTDKLGPHFKTDIFYFLEEAWESWDMIITFPPCTHLSSSGARWWKDKQKDGRQQAAIDFFLKLTNVNCKKMAWENPIGIMSTKYRKPDQIIQPWQFGHKETKSTCLWLKGLPKLTPTNIVKPEFIIGKNGRKYSRIHFLNKSTCQNQYGMSRQKFRSLTYQGIADAMADQWG